MAKRIIETVAFDPSQSNFAIAEIGVDIDSLELHIRSLKVITTESETSKGVIKVSDNLRRARELHAGMMASLSGKALAFAEIPLMITSQNPRIASMANYNSGMMVGLLSAVNIPLIQVFPKDVKIAMTGMKDACKEEMIEAAMNKYPGAPWMMRKSKGKLVPMNINEHLADAVGAAEAGVLSEQFSNAIAMFKSMAA